MTDSKKAPLSVEDFIASVAKLQEAASRDDRLEQLFKELLLAIGEMSNDPMKLVHALTEAIKGIKFPTPQVTIERVMVQAQIPPAPPAPAPEIRFIPALERRDEVWEIHIPGYGAGKTMTLRRKAA